MQAEALAESTDWQAALTGIKQLQADWKAVGPVRRNRAELLWKRFRAACDKFFERYGSRHQIAEQQRVEQREGVVKQIEALAAEVAAGTLPEGIAATVQRSVDAVAERRRAVRRGRRRAAGPLRRRPARGGRRGGRGLRRLALRRRRAGRAPHRALRRGRDRGRRSRRSRPRPGSSPAATLAALLRESLAANTIGGRVNEDSKLRVVADKVRRAQQQWRDLGPAFGEAAAALEGRFHHAVRRFFDRHPELRHAPGRRAAPGRWAAAARRGGRPDGPRGDRRGPGGPGGGRPDNRGPRPDGRPREARPDRDPRPVSS